MHFHLVVAVVVILVAIVVMRMFWTYPQTEAELVTSCFEGKGDMADRLYLMLNVVARGLRDAILGTLKVYQLDQDMDQATSDIDTQQTQPSTALARRRAERMKKKEPKKQGHPKVLSRMFQCCAWNGGVFWMSILVFNHAIIPSLEFLTNILFGGSSTHSMVWSWIGPMLAWTFNALWILPLFILSKVINCFWFQDIADAAYRKSRGRPQMLPSLSKIIADILFSLLLESVFLMQGMLANKLPMAGLGHAVYMLHMCLLYSLYAFEYKWFNMGWEVHKRLSYIENNWLYFVGFGLPLALLTAIPTSFAVSGCVFSILFPLSIISANEAEPIVQSIDFPLKLFAPTVAISDALFKHSVKKTQTHQSAKYEQSSLSTKQVRVHEPR